MELYAFHWLNVISQPTVCSLVLSKDPPWKVLLFFCLSLSGEFRNPSPNNGSLQVCQRHQHCIGNLRLEPDTVLTSIMLTWRSSLLMYCSNWSLKVCDSIHLWDGRRSLWRATARWKPHSEVIRYLSLSSLEWEEPAETSWLLENPFCEVCQTTWPGKLHRHRGGIRRTLALQP